MLKKTISFFFFVLVVQLLYSQYNLTSSGGGTSDAGGMIIYSVGQLFYTYLEEDNNTLSEGVLQPYYEKKFFTYNNGTWSPRDPSGVSFAEDSISVINGDVVIDKDTYCSSLTIDSGASVTVLNSKSITVNDEITLNSSSTSFSSLIGDVNGTMSYNRYTSQIDSKGGVNDLISAPVENLSFATFANQNSGKLVESGSLRSFGDYNTTTDKYEPFDINTDSHRQLELGKGYIAATEKGSELKFTGEVSNNDVNVTMSDDGLAWNLIGNPYASYINFKLFYDENKNKFDDHYQAIYGYNGTTDLWTIWNKLTPQDSKIAPGQAFFVKAKTATTAVKFTPSMQTIGKTDDFILNKQAKTDFVMCNLYLSRENDTVATKIYFIEDSTRGLDPGYDAAVNDSGDFSNLLLFTSLVSDSENSEMAIQSLPCDDLNNVVVPLGIKAELAELTIGINDNTTTLPSNIHVYLEDRIASAFTLLNSSNYTFTPTGDLQGSDQFFLHFSSIPLTTENISFRNIEIYNRAASKEIIIKGVLGLNTKVLLYDKQGRKVLQKDLKNSSITNQLDVANLSAGIYIIKILSSNKVKIQKIFIQ